MHLYDIPMICVLIGVALYAVLGGADFGAGFWQLSTILLPGRSDQARQRAQRIREHAHHSMETGMGGQPRVADLRADRDLDRLPDCVRIDRLHAGSTAVHRRARGGLPRRRLRAAGRYLEDLRAQPDRHDLLALLDPHAIRTRSDGRCNRLGTGAGRQRERAPALQLAEPDLDPDRRARRRLLRLHGSRLPGRGRRRHGEAELVGQLGARALLAGAVAGLVATAGLLVLHSDAHRIFERLVDGPGLAGLTISVLSGIATLALVASSRFAAARISSALAVVGVIAGWALAQQPIFLPHLTIQQAAAQMNL